MKRGLAVSPHALRWMAYMQGTKRSVNTRRDGVPCLTHRKNLSAAPKTYNVVSPSMDTKTQLRLATQACAWGCF